MSDFSSIQNRLSLARQIVQRIATVLVLSTLALSSTSYGRSRHSTIRKGAVAGVHVHKKRQSKPKKVAVKPATTLNLEDLVFTGHYRKNSKISIVRSASGDIVAAQHFANLRDLLNDLPPDATIRSKYHLTTSNVSNVIQERVDEEKKNVEVDCWIHAIKFEDHSKGAGNDNDFHIIVGSSSNPATAKYMNVEVSGLPSTDGKDKDAIRGTRTKLLSMFPGKHFTDHFTLITPARHVTVRGSLFFDGGHAAGAVGPNGKNPTTVWEIHPIVSIEGL